MWWNAPLLFPSVVSLPLPLPLSLLLPLLPGLFTSYASRPTLTLVPGAGQRHRRPRSSSSAANHVRPSIPSILFPTSPNVLPTRDEHSLRYTTPPLKPQLTCPFFFCLNFFCWVRPTDTGTRGAYPNVLLLWNGGRPNCAIGALSPEPRSQTHRVGAPTRQQRYCLRACVCACRWCVCASSQMLPRQLRHG